MAKAISFDELLEAVEYLPLDTQESFIGVLRHRISERRRDIESDILSARRECNTGKLTPQEPEDIMRDIERFSETDIPEPRADFWERLQRFRDSEELSEVDDINEIFSKCT